MVNYSIKWLDYFFNMIECTKELSKDPSTKVAAVLVKDRRVLACCYNGFPHGVDDSVERYNDRATKLTYVSHAEANCITQCARYGIPTEGLTLFVGLMPCAECAKLIIQAGISTIIYKPSDINTVRTTVANDWRDNTDHSLTMLKEAGVDVLVYDPILKSLVHICQYRPEMEG